MPQVSILFLNPNEKPQAARDCLPIASYEMGLAGTEVALADRLLELDANAAD